jgi:hypothetical protein
MRRRYLIPIAVLAAVVAAFATRGADAQSPPAGKSVTVLGIGTHEVDLPKDRSDRAERERAVDAAEAEAAKKAVADARERAGRLAAAAGLTLGELQRVEERGAGGTLVVRELPAERPQWEGHQAIAAQFLDWLDGAPAPPTTLADNIQSNAMLFAAMQAAADTTVVDVQQMLRDATG